MSVNTPLFKLIDQSNASFSPSVKDLSEAGGSLLLLLCVILVL